MASSATLYRAVSFSANCARYRSCIFSELKLPPFTLTLLRPSSSYSASLPDVARQRPSPLQSFAFPSPKVCNISRQIRNLSKQAEQIRKSNKVESPVDNETETTPIEESSGDALASSPQPPETATVRERVHIPPSFLGAPDESDQWSRRALKWFGRNTGFYTRKAVFTRGSLHLYADLIDSIDYAEFFEVCKLPDTMQSWFLVAHLHIWFLMVRLKREGEEGKMVIKHIVEMFWKDVKNRMGMMGVHHGKLATESMRELTQQFYGLTIAYEEGLQSDDKVLAAAVWRNYVTEKERTNPEVLVAMVDYIRRQVQHMDSIDATDIMVHGKLPLLPLKNNSK